MSSGSDSRSTGGGRTRVWYLITALSIGGTERTVVDLANGLDHDRFDVTIWTLFEQNPLATAVTEEVTLRSLGAEGITPSDGEYYIERAESSFDYFRVPLRFLRAVRAEQPEILQSFLFYDNLIARLAGAICPETTVITGVRSVPENRSRRRELLDRATVSLSDRIVSNSKAGAEFTAERGASVRQIEVIYNGRDLDRYDIASSADPDGGLDLPKDARVVGTVGRLIERKGHRDLLAAWPAVRERVPDAYLLVVGDGPERASLERYASDLGCRESVRFLGFRGDVPALLDLIDVFVFPSHFEGLPGALIEAMAAGLPIVATPVTGNAELIGNYRTGLHVAPRDPTAIAWGLIRVLEHPSLGASLGEAARRKARREFTLDRMTSEFERLYDSLRGERPDGSSHDDGSHHDRPRVCFLINTLDPAGAETLLLEIVRNTDEAVSYTVCYFGGDGSLAPAFEQAGARVVDLGARSDVPQYDPIAIARLVRFFRKQRFDILHAHLPYSIVLGRLVGAVCNAGPVVSTHHNVPSAYNRIEGKLERATRSLDSATVAVSDGVRHAHVGRSSNASWTTIYNGIDVEDFSEEVARAGPLPVDHDRFIEGGTVYLNVGRYIPAKAQDDLIRAMPAVLDEFPGAKLIVVGWGTSEADLRGTVRELDLEEAVLVTGRVDSVHEYYAAADVFVSSSVIEGMPISLLEAMAAGLPVVATDIPGVQEVVLDGETGLLVSPNAPPRLASAMAAMGPSKRRARYARKARDHVRARFSIEATVESHLELYRSLMD